jgi:hypothetical protein
MSRSEGSPLGQALLKALAHVMHTGDYKTVLANWGAENGCQRA